jgi:hypothetical protein
VADDLETVARVRLRTPEQRAADDEIDLIGLIIERLPKLGPDARARVIRYAESIDRDLSPIPVGKVPDRSLLAAMVRDGVR